MSNTIESQLTIHQIFEQQVSLYPKKIALVYGQTELTYNELNDKANQLANLLLKEYKITPHETIAILSEPSEWIIISIIAILKIGCNYLPLSNRFPKERTRFMIDDSKIKLTLTQNSFQNNLEKFNCETLTFEDIALKLHSFSSINLNLECSSEDLAYVMYTSGTTGVPNGVEIPHRGVVRLVCGADYIPFDENLTFLQLSTFTFDASTFEIWGALLNGHKLVIYESQSTYFQDLKEVIETTNVNCIWLTSSLFNLVVEEDPDTISNIKYLLIGGEALSPKHVRIAQSKLPNTQIINGYGPTESTTFATTYKIPPICNDARSIPIGTAINETDIYILDENLQQVEAGEEGELYIGGRGLAIGYRNQPELTAERFIKHPYSTDKNDRLYKTGDICRKNIEGKIEFVGRNDFQLKIRGFRIEIGDIETALQRCEGVAQATIIIKKTGIETKIVAYVSNNRKFENNNDLYICNSINTSILKSKLRDWLPDYMIPHQIIEINQIPLNLNGKIDKTKLAETELNNTTNNDELKLEILTITEESILNIWKDLFNLTEISIDSNFFEIGGFSLLGVQLISKINLRFSSELKIGDLYKESSIRKLAKLIDSKDKLITDLDGIVQIKEGFGEPVFLLPGGKGDALSFVHLLKTLKTEKPIYVIEFPTKNNKIFKYKSMSDIANIIIPKIEKLNSKEKFHFIGYSFGGRLAFEIATQLQKMNREIGLLLIIDIIGIKRRLIDKSNFHFFALFLILKRKIGYHSRKLFFPFFLLFYRKEEFIQKKNNELLFPHFYKILDSQNRKNNLYKGDVILFRSTYQHISRLRLHHHIYKHDPYILWKENIKGNIDLIEIECNHIEFLCEPFVKKISEVLNKHL